MNYVDQLYIFLDVVIATALTSLIGIEREKENKPAGIRTNMIIGGFSCLIVSLTAPLVEFLNQFDSLDMVKADPIRVFNALIVGISFVGAGTIIKETNKMRVQGLTTAATLLYSSGIGISVALKQYVLAICVTLLTVFINTVLWRLFEKK